MLLSRLSITVNFDRFFVVEGDIFETLKTVDDAGFSISGLRSDVSDLEYKVFSGGLSFLTLKK